MTALTALTATSNNLITQAPLFSSLPQQEQTQAASQNQSIQNQSIQKKMGKTSLITQFIVGECDYRSMLLPVLSHQTQKNNERWTTLIASHFIQKSELQDFGVQLSKLRMIVDATCQHSSWKLLISALSNGNSSMVVASLPSLSNKDILELEHAAQKGSTQGLIITSRTPNAFSQ